MSKDLTDAELDELDDLLAGLPEPLQPLGLAMLDGYLAGVLVQPRLLPRAEWLPPVFDLEGRPLPTEAEGAGQRAGDLVERRLQALNEEIAEDGGFDPILPLQAEDADDAAARDALRELPEVSRRLFPWVAGFQYALTLFGDLDAAADSEIEAALRRVLRHLPPEDDAERAQLQALAQEQPLTSEDDALSDLVTAVAELWDLTADRRYRVEPVRRDTPKVGRNDPCPCGSGRKYKHCHGAG
jgi:uncharacterized protein